MYLAFRLALSAAACCAIVPAAELRVCADPYNLPYSNAREQGFENELARMVAGDLHRTLRYYWAPQHAHFIKALRQNRCDVFMGVPYGFGPVATSRPYYRSTYVFVSRREGGHVIRSLDDPVLRHKRIAVQLPGDDGAALPPAHALNNRGLLGNVAWYRLVQNYLSPNSPGVLVDAVRTGNVDLAIAWGPTAAWFARMSSVKLDVVPVAPSIDRRIPFYFDISVGVRRSESALLHDIDAVLERRAAEVRAMLHRYGVPLLPQATGSRASNR